MYLRVSELCLVLYCRWTVASYRAHRCTWGSLSSVWCSTHSKQSLLTVHIDVLEGLRAVFCALLPANSRFLPCTPTYLRVAEQCLVVLLPSHSRFLPCTQLYLRVSEQCVVLFLTVNNCFLRAHRCTWSSQSSVWCSAASKQSLPTVYTDVFEGLGSSVCCSSVSEQSLLTVHTVVLEVFRAVSVYWPSASKQLFLTLYTDVLEVPEQCLVLYCH